MRSPLAPIVVASFFALSGTILTGARLCTALQRRSSGHVRRARLLNLDCSFRFGCRIILTWSAKKERLHRRHDDQQHDRADQHAADNDSREWPLHLAADAG